MKKIMIYILIIVLVLILIVFAIPIFMVVFDLGNPLRQSHEQIKAELLELMPIGSSMDEVIRVIEGHGEWETRYVNYGRGIPAGELGRVGEPIGERSIRVTMGLYRGTLKFSGNPLETFWWTHFDTFVVVYWAFDENSELIEIIVHKQMQGF